MSKPLSDVPVTSIQTGSGPVCYKTPQLVPDEFKSFEPLKKFILMECKQENLEPVIARDIDDIEIFNDSCNVLEYEPTENIPTDAFAPPEIGNIGEFENDINITKPKPSQPVDHKFQESKKPLHQPTGKYHIMELFWFMNPLYITNLDDIELSQAHFCTISFNIDFGNMKVTFYKIPNGALEGHKIYLMSCQRMTSVSIYPSALFKLIRSETDFRSSSMLADEIRPVVVTCMEQMIFKTGEQWQQERPIAIFETDANIKLRIKDPKYGESYYIFQNWQKDALIHAAKFILNEGLSLTGKNIIMGNRVG